MNYRVLFLSAADQALAAAYLTARAAGDAVAFNRAVREAEGSLTDEPETAGESRAAGTGKRLLAVPPAVIEYEVFPDDRVAVVSNVRYVPPKRRG